ALPLLAPETAACTILREPVARTLSHFAHVRVHGRERQLTLDEFVTAAEWRRQWENYQARQLVVDLPIDEAWIGALPNTLQSLLDTAPLPMGGDALLEAATARLESIDLR